MTIKAAELMHYERKKSSYEVSRLVFFITDENLKFFNLGAIKKGLFFLPQERRQSGTNLNVQKAEKKNIIQHLKLFPYGQNVSNS